MVTGSGELQYDREGADREPAGAELAPLLQVSADAAWDLDGSTDAGKIARAVLSWLAQQTGDGAPDGTSIEYLKITPETYRVVADAVRAKVKLPTFGRRTE